MTLKPTTHNELYRIIEERVHRDFHKQLRELRDTFICESDAHHVVVSNFERDTYSVGALMDLIVKAVFEANIQRRVKTECNMLLSKVDALFAALFESDPQ